MKSTECKSRVSKCNNVCVCKDLLEHGLQAETWRRKMEHCKLLLSPLFVQLMDTIYYKTVKQLKSFKIRIVAPTCFDLHKPSSGSSQPVLR